MSKVRRSRLSTSTPSPHRQPMPPKKPQTPRSDAQATLASFLIKPATPSSSSKDVKGKGRAVQTDVITLDDSDDSDDAPIARPGETDEQMAHRLAGKGQSGIAGGTGQGKRKFELVDVDEIVDGPSSPSTSRKPSQSIKSAGKQDTKPSTKRDPVYPDLDTDPLLFHPESIDVAYWPAGRVPYSFVVQAGFVHVAATRKRLAIVRILTKCERYSLLLLFLPRLTWSFVTLPVFSDALPTTIRPPSFRRSISSQITSVPPTSRTSSESVVRSCLPL